MKLLSKSGVGRVVKDGCGWHAGPNVRAAWASGRWEEVIM